jgi:short-subunit dehydrogenase
MTLRDRVVLITGASEGIGAACARAFRARGSRLALNARSAEKLSRVASDGDLILAEDVTESSTPRKLIDRTLASFGRLDVVVNNAGSGLYGPASGVSLTAANSVFALNFFAPLAIIQAAEPHMRAQRSGAIINIGSVAGEVVLPWMPLYCASKSALGVLSASLRTELKVHNIHVMHVCPGYVLTDFQAHSLGSPPQSVVEGKKIAITPNRCAQDILRGLDRGARTVVTPSWASLLIAAHRVAPALVQWQLNRMNAAGERP